MWFASLDDGVGDVLSDEHFTTIDDSDTSLQGVDSLASQVVNH